MANNKPQQENSGGINWAKIVGSKFSDGEKKEINDAVKRFLVSRDKGELQVFYNKRKDIPHLQEYLKALVKKEGDVLKKTKGVNKGIGGVSGFEEQVLKERKANFNEKYGKVSEITNPDFGSKNTGNTEKDVTGENSNTSSDPIARRIEEKKDKSEETDRIAIEDAIRRKASLDAKKEGLEKAEKEIVGEFTKYYQSGGNVKGMRGAVEKLRNLGKVYYSTETETEILEEKLEKEEVKIAYKKLEAKAEAIGEMKQFVKDNEKLPPEEFKTKLKAKAEEIKAKVGKEFDISGAVDGLGKDDDASFLEKVDFFVEDVGNKRSEVDDLQKVYKENPKDFFERINKIDPSINFSGNERVKFDGVMVSIALNDSNWKKNNISDQVGALTIGGYPVCVHREDSFRSTLNHEKNHILAESFDNSSAEYENKDRLLGDIKNKLKELLEESSDNEDLINSLGQDIIGLVDTQNHEILADLDRIGNQRTVTTFASSSSFYNDGLSKVKSALPLIEQKSSLLANQVKGFIAGSENKFSNNINVISNIYYAAQETGNLEKAKNSIILFSGKQNSLGKAEKLVRKIVGPQKYDVLTSLRPIAEGGGFIQGVGGDIAEKVKRDNGPAGFFAPTNLNKLKKALSPGGVSLDPDNRKEIVKNLNDNFLGDKGGDTVLSDVGGVDDFYQGKEDLSAIADSLDLPELKQIGDKEEDRFIDKQVEKSLAQGDFGNLQQIAEASPGKKEAILEKLGSDENRKKYQDFTASQKESAPTGDGSAMSQALSGEESNKPAVGADKAFDDDFAVSDMSSEDDFGGEDGVGEGNGVQKPNESAMAAQLREVQQKEKEKKKMANMSKLLAEHYASKGKRVGHNQGIPEGQLVGLDLNNRMGNTGSDVAGELRKEKNDDKKKQNSGAGENNESEAVGESDGDIRTRLNTAKRERQKEEGGSSDNKLRKGSKTALRFCWLNLFTASPLSILFLLYINAHTAVAYFIVPDIACKLGEEWTFDDLGSIGDKVGGKVVKNNLQSAEFALLAFANIVAVVLITSALGVICMAVIIGAKVSSIPFVSDILGAIWKLLPS